MDRIHRSLLCLAVPVVLSWFTTLAGAQTASQKYNRILQETEDDYYNCAKGIRDRDARKQAYIEHGKRAARLWGGFLREHGDTRMAFNARLNMAQALDMAKKSEQARRAVDEAVAAASNYFEIKRAAEVAKIVYHSTSAGYAVIEKNLARVDDPEMKASLHLELIKYIEVPANIKRGKSNKEARDQFKRRRHRELAAAVAKAYPKTRAGREAALMVAGVNLEVGAPLINLADYNDEEGKPLDLTAYKGKVILLHFWTGKRTSKKYLRELIKLYKELQPKGFELIGINADYAEDKERRMDRMVADLGIPWRNYHDGEKLHNRIALIYYVRKFPLNIIIGRDGKIAAIGEAMRDLEDVLPELLAKS